MEAKRGDIGFSSNESCVRLAEIFIWDIVFAATVVSCSWICKYAGLGWVRLVEAGSGDWDLCWVRFEQAFVWLMSMKSFVSDDDAIRRNNSWQWRLADASANVLSSTERFLLLCWLGMGASLLGTVVFLYFVERCDI